MLNKKIISSSGLKMFAILFMLIDHIAAANVVPLSSDQYFFMRLIGRLAYPIFAFLISEGFFHTKDIKKYLIRLGTFALISEFAFDLAFNHRLIEFSHQNIFFTLLLGLIAIIVFDKNKENNYSIGIIGVLGISLLAEMLNTDYGLYGVFVIFIFYYFKEKYIMMILSFLIWNLFFISMYSIIQSFSIFALLFIYLYNGKKGNNLKYLFYFFYPLHLFILYLIKYFVTRG